MRARRGLKPCISNKFPGDAAGLGTTLKELLAKIAPNFFYLQDKRRP